jgi:hypothetical protein
MNKKYDRINANQNCASASPCRSKSLRENYSLRLSPVGAAESSPGRESWVEVRETTQSRRDG